MNWIPAISTTTLLAVALWLARKLIITRLSNSVQHEFNVRIEGIRSEMRRKEEEFRAELRNRDDAIAAVRAAGLDALSANRVVLSKRRVEAVDQLLRSTKMLWAGTMAVNYVATLKMDLVNQEIERDRKLAQIFTALDTVSDKFLEDMKTSEAAFARPYVSETTWALYSAYQAIVVSCVSQLRMLRLGFSPKKFLDPTTMEAMVKEVLPERAAFIDQHRAGAYPVLLQELDRRLNDSLRADAEGVATSETTVRHAASLTRAASTLMAEVAAANTRIEVASAGPNLPVSIIAPPNQQPAP